MVLIKLFEILDLFRSELNFKAAKRSAYLLRLGEADYRSKHGSFLAHPGKRNLYHGNTALICDLLNTIDNGLIYVSGLCILFSDLVVVKLTVVIFVAPGVAALAGCIRAVRSAYNAGIITCPEHFALILTVEQVEVVLHGYKVCPAVLFSNAVRFFKLPREHCRCADIASLAGFDDIVHCFHGFLDWRIPVPAMEYVNVNIVELQALEAVVDLAGYRLARRAGHIGAEAHFLIYLGLDNKLIAINKAADELGYAQSGLTYIINVIESEFGVKLVNRSHSGIGLTPDGEILFPYLEQILERESEFYKRLELIKSGEGEIIRIGSYSSLVVSWLPNVITAFKRKHPGLNFEIRTGVSQLRQWLENNEVDLILCEKSLAGEHEWQYISDDEMCVAINKKLPLSKAPEITLDMLKDYHVIFPSILNKNAVSQKLLEQGISFKNQTLLYTDDGSITLSMVEKSNDGVSFITKLYTPECPSNVALRSLTPKITRQLGVIVNERQQSVQSIRDFVKFLKKKELVY